MNIPKKGDVISQFEVLSVDNLDEYRSTAIHLKHIKTGCRVYKIINDDEEKQRLPRIVIERQSTKRVMSNMRNNLGRRSKKRK